MNPKFTALIVVLFLVGVWVSPLSIAQQFEQRVKLVIVVVLSIVWFAAGYLIGRAR